MWPSNDARTHSHGTETHARRAALSVQLGITAPPRPVLLQNTHLPPEAAPTVPGPHAPPPFVSTEATTPGAGHRWIHAASVLCLDHFTQTDVAGHPSPIWAVSHPFPSTSSPGAPPGVVLGTPASSLARAPGDGGGVGWGGTALSLALSTQEAPDHGSPGEGSPGASPSSCPELGTLKHKLRLGARASHSPLAALCTGGRGRGLRQDTEALSSRGRPACSCGQAGSSV